MRPFFSFIIGGISLVLLTGLALASPFAYITNFSSNSVSVIDAATNGVVSTINVGNGPQPECQSRGHAGLRRQFLC